ncbi:hypothetical protein TKK_0005495 [Trichogramma kaykai]
MDAILKVACCFCLLSFSYAAPPQPQDNNQLSNEIPLLNHDDEDVLTQQPGRRPGPPPPYDLVGQDNDPPPYWAQDNEIYEPPPSYMMSQYNNLHPAYRANATADSEAASSRGCSREDCADCEAFCRRPTLDGLCSLIAECCCPQFMPNPNRF